MQTAETPREQRTGLAVSFSAEQSRRWVDGGPAACKALSPQVETPSLSRKCPAVQGMRLRSRGFFLMPQAERNLLCKTVDPQRKMTMTQEERTATME